ncbi:MAG: PIG-L family deacetylase [Planctomycetota bacterium]
MTDERAPLPEALERPPEGRALVFVPHADDDVIGCGGTSALHVEQGDPVKVVVIYSGVEGDPDGRYDPAQLIELRKREAQAGGRHLGLDDYEFWGYPEGHEPPVSQLFEAAQRVAETVHGYSPDVVYAPWVGEQHIDHHVAARVVRMGLQLADFGGDAWGFEVWTPLVATRIVDITGLYQRKVAALHEHRTQLEYTDHVHKALGMHAQRSLYLPSGSRWGEAFRPLGPPSDEERAFLEGAR